MNEEITHTLVWGPGFGWVERRVEPTAEAGQGHAPDHRTRHRPGIQRLGELPRAAGRLPGLVQRALVQREFSEGAEVISQHVHKIEVGGARAEFADDGEGCTVEVAVYGSTVMTLEQVRACGEALVAACDAVERR